MMSDGRNLTPLRALRLLRQFDEERYHLKGNAAEWTVDRVREALRDHVEYGLARARRRRRRAK